MLSTHCQCNIWYAIFETQHRMYFWKVTGIFENLKIKIATNPSSISIVSSYSLQPHKPLCVLHFRCQPLGIMQVKHQQKGLQITMLSNKNNEINPKSAFYHLTVLFEYILCNILIKFVLFRIIKITFLTITLSLGTDFNRIYSQELTQRRP